MAYVEDIDGFMEHRIAKWEDKRINELTQGFYRKIAKPLEANWQTNTDKVKDMIMVVEFMTGGQYTDDSLQVNKFEGYERGFTRWVQLVDKYNCSLTPAYDLLAMFAMCNNLKQEHLTNPTELTRALEDSFQQFYLKETYQKPAIEEEKTIGTGVQNSTFYQGMDTLNREASRVWKEEGMKAAVDHMLTGEGGRQLSYPEMRSRYGQFDMLTWRAYMHPTRVAIPGTQKGFSFPIKFPRSFVVGKLFENLQRRLTGSQ